MAQCRIARAVLGCPLEQTRDSPEETAGARRRLGAPSVLIARCEYERDAERSVRDTAGCAGSARGRSRISRISVCTSCGSADHAEQVPRVMPPRPSGYTDRLAACAARCCSGSFRYLPSTNIRFTSFTAGSDPAPGSQPPAFAAWDLHLSASDLSLLRASRARCLTVPGGTFCLVP